MRCFLGAFVVLLLSLPSSSFAEFYKYRDQNGMVRYTDNPLAIPKDQQEIAKSYREIKAIETAGEVTKVEDMNDIQKKLWAEKEILDREYEGLVAEREALEKAAEMPRNEAEYVVFEKEILDFNQRLRQYEEKRLLFKEKANVYNQARKAELNQ